MKLQTVLFLALIMVFSLFSVRVKYDGKETTVEVTVTDHLPASDSSSTSDTDDGDDADDGNDAGDDGTGDGGTGDTVEKTLDYGTDYTIGGILSAVEKGDYIVTLQL